MTEPVSTRPRSERARTAILIATRDLVAEVGYEQMTIEGIASRAKVGKQTIYRWWRSKSAILAECVLDGLVLPPRDVPADTGDLREDLVAWLRGTLADLSSPGTASLLRGLIAAAAEDSDLAAVLYERLTGPQESSLMGRLHTVASEGEGDDAAAANVVEMLFGTIVYRALCRLSLEPDLAEGLVDTVLEGLPRPS